MMVIPCNSAVEFDTTCYGMSIKPQELKVTNRKNMVQSKATFTKIKNLFLMQHCEQNVQH